MISNMILFWLGVLGEFYALASLHACECCHDSMLTMRLIAYVLYLPECLRVKVGLFGLEQFIKCSF